MRLDTSGSEGNVGFQIAPMIDVVFVIMLFFMVMAGEVKVEKELNTTLPGTAEVTSGAQEDIEEQIIQIAESGEITLNDETMAGPNEKQMTLLKDTLKRLKQTCDAQKTPAVITILSEEKAKYSRTVDVLDALAYAQITTVTFTTTEGEE
jgi:biopolymer transport protein ExbD